MSRGDLLANLLAEQTNSAGQLGPIDARVERLVEAGAQRSNPFATGRRLIDEYCAQIATDPARRRDVADLLGRGRRHPDDDDRRARRS